MPDRPDTDLYAALRFAADIQPTPCRWLWPGRIPLGKLTLLIGDPGVGKSLLVADLAARVSAGLPWPDSPPALRASVPSSVSQGVILVCPEDLPTDTLHPRLAAGGADLASICILEGVTPTLRSSLRRSGASSLSSPPSSLPPEPRTLSPEPSLLPFTLPAHADVLEQAIRAVNQPRLVILDPLHAALSLDAQPMLDGAVARLADIAHNYAVAIVAVGHLVKARSQRMLYRVRGSLALVAAARAVQLLYADPDDPHRRILFPLL